jgi:predicted AAA+ superfamily ATPase
MKRDIELNLKAWKDSDRRMPLVLQGARQVGKTYSVQEFGKNNYREIAYFNLEQNTSLRSLFEGDIDPDRIVSTLSLASGTKIEKGETLIFFDEIQESNRALNSLKYFAEKASEYHVIAAGSLLGVHLSRPGSFPVGKVNFLYLFPLSFYEFLDAQDESELRQFLEAKKDFSPVPKILHDKLIDYLKIYYVTGGMPESVKAYVETQNSTRCRNVQQEILSAYLLDFSKHVPGIDIPKISAIWNSLPAQLAKENKKFVFKLVREGARARMYEDSLSWLELSGLVYRIRQVSAPGVPLSSYASSRAFKIYMLDVGLLGALSHLRADIILEGNRLFTEFFGSFTENYAAQELITGLQTGLYYWTSEGKAEVDFLLETATDIIPLEVKATINTKSKSLKMYGEQTGAERLFRTNLLNFAHRGKIHNIPLYALRNVIKIA